MRPSLVSALVAAVVAGAFFLVSDIAEDRGAGTEQRTGPSFRYTDELVEDAWVNAARTAGADNKPLADAAGSICFLTKIEIKGIQGPEDASSCRIAVDEFTGFWEVIATVEEGGRSEVRCNARCLVWE